MYVLDTNSVIYLFRGEGQVSRRLLQVSRDQIALPTVVLFELETGIAKSEEPARRRLLLDHLVSNVRVLPFDLEEARVAARIRATLERAGTPIGPLDTLIAGVALAHGATLITRNLREFSRVPGLLVEDWY